MKNLIIIFKGFFLFLALCFQSCSREEALPVTADFEFEVFNNDFSVPVEVILFNATRGAEDYLWTFEGGVPQIATQRNPGVITYNVKGTYNITLKASNDDGSEDTFSQQLVIEDPIEIDFITNPSVDFFSPSIININNTTEGAETFKWTFEGGVPNTSTNRNPPEIVFTNTGVHQIILEASNGFETQTLTKEIEVLPLLEVDFDFEIDFEDDDLQIPVRVNLINNSISATDFSWQFTGATTTTSSVKNPTVVFNRVGVQTISLTAANGKQTQTTSKQIEVFANSNLRVLKNIQLGINTAHNNNVIGAAYSLYSRTVFTKNQITEDTGDSIDFLFFGLNNRFTRNTFVSPDNLENTTFTTIPNANTTKIINNIENCNCGIELSSAQFEAMQTDAILQSFNITETTGGNLSFDNSILPRIVIFQTSDGRKGAIQINRFVDNSTNSFIEIDIKVQKEAR